MSCGSETPWRTALPVSRVRLPAGDEQRRLARDRSHCASCVFVLPFVPSPITRSSSSTSSRRRSTGRSRRVAAASRRSGRSARRAGPREARFVHVMDLSRQSRATVVVEPVYHQALLRGRWRSWRRNGRRAGLTLRTSPDSHIDFVLLFFP